MIDQLSKFLFNSFKLFKRFFKDLSSILFKALFRKMFLASFLMVSIIFCPSLLNTTRQILWSFSSFIFRRIPLFSNLFTRSEMVCGAFPVKSAMLPMVGGRESDEMVISLWWSSYIKRWNCSKEKPYFCAVSLCFSRICLLICSQDLTISLISSITNTKIISWYDLYLWLLI